MCCHTSWSIVDYNRFESLVQAVSITIRFSTASPPRTASRTLSSTKKQGGQRREPLCAADRGAEPRPDALSDGRPDALSDEHPDAERTADAGADERYLRLPRRRRRQRHERHGSVR